MQMGLSKVDTINVELGGGAGGHGPWWAFLFIKDRRGISHISAQ